MSHRGPRRRVPATRILLLALAVALMLAGIAYAATGGLQNASFESGLDGWTANTVSSDDLRSIVYPGADLSNCRGDQAPDPRRVCLLDGPDRFTITKTENATTVNQDITVTPNDGTHMVRLGGPFTSVQEPQSPAVAEQIEQTFVVDPANPILQLNFDAFTWDYQGFDELRFHVTLQDEDGATIADFRQGAFGPSGDTSFKTTGWQPAYVDLTGYEGQQVHLRISSSGTKDSLFGFWSYVDAGLVRHQDVGQPSVQPPVLPGTTQPAPVYPASGATSGEIEYWIPLGGAVDQFGSGDDQGQSFDHCMDLPISVPIHPGSGSVSNVQLLLHPADGGDRQWTMSGPGAGGVWSATLHCVATGDLYVSYTLTENGESQDFVVPIGGLTLVDPSGVVYDQAAYDAAVAAGSTPDQARAAAAVSGATVRLQRKLNGAFVNVLSGDPGISPHVNPETTASDGRYAWLTADGTYRVVVTKDGYQQAVSREVTVPPAVTDLHVGLARVPASGGGPGGGAPGGGAPGGGPAPPAHAAVACAGLRGKRLAACRLDQRVVHTCGAKPSARQRLCARRVRALAACAALKAKTRREKQRKAACVRRAKAIGKRAHRHRRR